MSRRRQPQAETPADSVQNATEDAPSKEGSKKGSILPAGLYHSLDLASVLALVFGGCCTNVWTYEELLRMNPRMGSALTFSQMLFIAAQALPGFVVRQPGSALPTLAPRRVPLQRWALQVLVLTSSSLLNNWVFKFNVPLAVQIVFRSAGLAVSMFFGWLVRGKRYAPAQVGAVLLVSAGVVLAALARPNAPAPAAAATAAAAGPPTQYALGITMLVASLFLSGWLGMLQEQTYELYGPHWREGMFYTHALSLPIFLFLVQDVKDGFAGLPAPDVTGTKAAALAYVPYAVLAANLATQAVCVTGVNQLTSRVSSVSTNLALTVRKALSLCWSVYYFGNGWNPQFAAGAGLVFAGSFLYALFNKRTSRGLGPQAKEKAS